MSPVQSCLVDAATNKVGALHFDTDPLTKVTHYSTLGALMMLLVAGDNGAVWYVGWATPQPCKPSLAGT